MIKKEVIEGIFVDVLELYAQRYDSLLTVVIQEELLQENRPKPPKPFVTIKIISGPIAIGTDNLREESGKFSLTALRQFSISLQAYGQGAYDALAHFQTLLDDFGISVNNKEKIGEFLSRKNVAVVDRGQVLDISAVIDTGYERRANLDLTINYAENTEVDTSTIETARIKGTIKNEKGNIKEVEVIEVTNE